VEGHGIIDRFLNWIRDLVESRHTYKLELHRCQSCDYLRSLIDQEKEEKKNLLAIIKDFNTPKVVEVREETTPPRPVPTSSYIPFRVRRQQLEQASMVEKKRQDELKLQRVEESKSTEQLEDELLNDK
jgi:hypothetical protein